MKPRDRRYDHFVVVGRLRSFSAAARELGVSRSAIRQSLKQLEEQLRVVLLIRTTRRGLAIAS